MDDFEIRVRCQHQGCGTQNLVDIGTAAPNLIRCSRCQNVILDYTPIQGYVYVLSNVLMQGLIKIGFTTRDVEQRVAELNSATGVPGPFNIEAIFPTEAPEIHEQQVHKQLAEDRVKGKEFFKKDLPTTLRLITEICGSRPKYIRDPTLLDLLDPSSKILPKKPDFIYANPKDSERPKSLSDKPPYICHRCGVKMWSLTEVVEFWGKIYCKDCNPC
jgi:hypothetical protein